MEVPAEGGLGQRKTRRRLGRPYPLHDDVCMGARVVWTFSPEVDRFGGMSIQIFSFYNNKGGVGKTTLCTNVAARYADKNPDTQVLVVDICPQANTSQFFLGGGQIGHEKNQEIQAHATRKNIVGFVDWLLKGNSGFASVKSRFGIQVAPHNDRIPENVYLIAGDSFLEALSLALSYAVINPANLSAWKEFMTALRRLSALEHIEDEYKDLVVFIDCNPSFSIYTQMALLSSDYLIIPMMADYSSAEGISSLFTMLYGVYPTSALEKYAQNILTFKSQIERFGLELPKIWEFVFNNYTTNRGVATAYESIRNELANLCYGHYTRHNSFFATPNFPTGNVSEWEKVFMSQVKDFHTAGKISSSLGIPMYQMPDRTRYIMPDKTPVIIKKDQYEEALTELDLIVDQIP